MAAPNTEQVRNVVLVGQDGSGKTSLAEAMLFVSGKTPRMGTTHDGKSFLDYDEEEIKRRFTISAAVAPVPYKDFKINVIDTSGHPDFIGDTKSCMQAAEMALFVVDAVDGPLSMTSRLWREAEDMRLSRAIFINHIDREGADFALAMAHLHARFGSRVMALTTPMGYGEDFKGVIDVIRMKARVHENGVKKDIDIPAEYMDVATENREKLCDLIAEADDELMMKFLEGEELTQEEIESLLDKAIAQELIIPVFTGSTIIEQGITALMEDIVRFFPTPQSHGAFYLADGEEIFIEDDKRPAGFVFKTVADPYVGRLSYLKVISGTIEPGMELVNSRSGKKERLGTVNIIMGKELTPVKSAKAGDIVVIPKLAETETGDTLSATGEISIVPVEMPHPQYPVAIEAADRKSEDKLAAFLNRAIENDPTVHLQMNEETGQTVLYTMGETQLDLVLSRAKAAGIEVKRVPVRIPYRETIRKTASAQGRHKKQTGGAGQFGDCWLRLEPNPGEGYEFVDETKGGVIPGGLIPAVDKGVQETMKDGVLAGYPMQDIKVAVFDGSYHSVDSNEMAFKTAARIGFKAAVAQAEPVILEPMAKIHVTVGEEFAGAIMGDISTRRGRIYGTDSDDWGDTIIKARVPYAEVVEYTKDLRSITRGTGSYELVMDGYEQAPRDVQDKLVAAYEEAKQA